MELNANIQLVINSFGTLFPDKIFSLTFPWHFQVFQTRGHPENPGNGIPPIPTFGIGANGRDPGIANTSHRHASSSDRANTIIHTKSTAMKNSVVKYRPWQFYRENSWRTCCCLWGWWQSASRNACDPQTLAYRSTSFPSPTALSAYRLTRQHTSISITWKTQVG